MVVMSMLERHVSNSSLRSRPVAGTVPIRGAPAVFGRGTPLQTDSNGTPARQIQVADYNLFRRRHIDTIVRNILIALKKPKDLDVSFIYHLVSQLNLILQYQRRYLTVSESTYLDEIVTVPTLLKVVDTIASPDFVGWRCAGNYDSNVICREIELRTLITALRLLRWHGVKALSGDLLDRLVKRLPSFVDQKVPKTISEEDKDGTIDSRTADQLLVSRIFHDFSAVSASASADLPDSSRKILGLSDLVHPNIADWHVLYIELDDLLWNLSELYRRIGGPKSQNAELDEAALHEIEKLIVEQLERILVKSSVYTEIKDEKGLKKDSSEDDTNHWTFGILDLLQKLASEALGEDALRKVYQVAVDVVKVNRSPIIRCKAFDVLSQLTHRGVVATVQVDSELRALDIDRKEYFNLLEQRDRSNARLLTKRRLHEQSEVQREASIFKLPERGPEPLIPEPDQGGDQPVATLRFRSRPSVALPLIADVDEWRTFLTEVEIELECEGQKRIASSDLCLLSCGCVMSEEYIRSELRGKNTCPNCQQPTEIKRPLDKLRRLYRLVTDKKLELGMNSSNNHRFSVVISSPGGIDDLSDPQSSDRDTNSMITLPMEPGEAAIPSPDNMIFGSPGQGGGFPKEVAWENPSVKFTPETLEMFFGERGIYTGTNSNISPGGSSTPSGVNGNFEPQPIQKSSRTNSSSEDIPIHRKISSQVLGHFRKGSADSKATSPTTIISRPSVNTQTASSYTHSNPHNISPAVSRSNSIPFSSTSHNLELTRSLSPTRHGDPSSPPHSRFNGPSRAHTMDATVNHGATSPVSPQYNLRNPPLSSSPSHTRHEGPSFSLFPRKRAPSHPATDGNSAPSVIQGQQRMMSPVFDDNISEEEKSKLIRNPSDGPINRIEMWMNRNQTFPQENTVLRPPLDREEETRQLSFNKNFPFFKAEYVHHIQTGSRLRLPDVVATAIAPNCTKFAILEKKKFKVYSILSSDKTPELLCCGKSTGEYGSYLEPYNNISTEDKVIGKQLRWEYLMTSCSNRFLAIAGTHGTLKVHDLSLDGQPIYSYISESYDIRCIAICGDGQTVALGVVTLEHGKEISQIILHHIETSPNPSGKSLDPTKITLPYADPTGVLSFSEDSTYLACSTVRESRFLVYDLASRPPKLVMKSSRKLDISHDAEGITSVRFFPGNRLLCVTSVASGAPPIVVDSHIGVLDPTTGQPVNKIGLVTRLNKVGDKVHGCCVSPTGQALCAIDRSGNILVVNFPHGLVNDEGRRPRCLKVTKVQGAIKMTEAASIAFSPDGQRLIVVDRKADITIVDFAEIDESKMTKSIAWE